MPEQVIETPTQVAATPQTPQTASGFDIGSLVKEAFPDGKPLPATAEAARKKRELEPPKEPSATPAAQAQTPPTDEEAPPAEVKSDAGKANWKMLRTKAKERDDFEAKLKAATNEIENYKKNPPKAEAKIPEDYDEIKKQHAEFSDRLKLLDLQNHPEFQRHFNSKYDAVYNTAKLIAGKDGDKLVGLLKQPESELRDKQIEEIYSSVSPLYQSQLGAIMLELKRVNAERDMELSKGKDNYTKFIQMQQEGQRKQQELAQAQANREFEAQLQEAQKGLPVFQKRDGDEAWNKQVDSTIQTARDIFCGKLSLPEMARAAQWAAVTPVVLQDALAKAEEIKNLTAELTRLKAVQPKPGGGTDPKEPEAPANLSLTERMTWMAKQGGAVR